MFIYTRKDNIIARVNASQQAYALYLKIGRYKLLSCLLSYFFTHMTHESLIEVGLSAHSDNGEWFAEVIIDKTRLKSVYSSWHLENAHGKHGV